MKWTSEKTWYDNHHSNSSFICTPQLFSKNKFRGLHYLKKEVVPFLGGGETYVNSEVIYQKHPVLEEVKSKSILIIGGGPSTNSVVLNNGDYDFVVSCNHFFLNEKINSMKIDLAFLGDEVNLSGVSLNEYAKNSNTVFCFENIGHKKQDLIDFKSIYSNRVLWAHTRYHSKIGAIPRIVSLAASLNPKAISVVGMDGYVPYSSQRIHEHAFQKGKRYDGSFERQGDENTILRKYKQQYLEFWDYILHDVGKDVKFYNLGHGHPVNMTTEVLTKVLGGDYREYLANPEVRA